MSSKKKDAIKIPPMVKGFFAWNENSCELDFVQTSSGKEVHPLLDPANQIDGSNRRNFNYNGLRSSTQGSKSRLHGRIKENTTISIEDVKAVAANLLVTDRLQRGFFSLTNEFELVMTNSSFKSLLIFLLRYFACFFERLDLKHRMNETTYLHPSNAEISQAEAMRQKLVKSRTLVAQQYCVLVLGIGMPGTHHSECGEKRNSSTLRDMHLFEEIYSFFTFFVWVAFGRRNYKLIFTEVGDLLRSETFNPAHQRVYQKIFHKVETSNKKEPEKEPAEKDDSEDLKDSFRLPKRPPITHIINQRSKVITSLLPTSKERSSYLYGRSQASTMQFKASGKLDSNDLSLLNVEAHIEPDEKLGIIGESYEVYNREDLTRIDDDDEEGVDNLEQRDASLILDSSSMVSSPNKSRHSQQKKPFSRVTTAEGGR